VNLIIDENLPPRWVQYLESPDLRVTHWKDIGKVGEFDEIIIEYARDHEAVIVTQDLDFTRLLALRGSRLPSVIQCRVECPTPEIIGLAVREVLEKYRRQLLAGCLITLDLNRHRVRLLPLT
jgi:predicted nuclease of predicted toxin-antitoxin system